jgi:cytoskeletal protein RodZ
MAAFNGWRLTRTGILFVVGILVLGGLVTGGIFLVKNHGEAVRHDQAVKIAEQNLKDQSQTSTQPVTSSDSSNSGNSSNTDTTTATDGSTDTTTTAAASPSELPVTGIDDLQFIGRAAMLAVLALSAAYYVASRRATQRL